MKIEGFKISNYGPLHDYAKAGLQNFTLFFGENEDGKSLTIDALTKLMFGGRELKEFEAINRVDEKPEGHVSVRDSKGKLLRITNGSFRKNCDLTSSECRNIFLIRNSDLSIASENKFYDSIGSRLMGLRTGEILSIETKLKELGDLTPSCNFKNETKNKIDSSKILVEEIGELQSRIEAEDIDELEAKSIELTNSSDELKHRNDLFADASKRETYERGQEALTILEQNLGSLGDLEVFNEEDQQIWRDALRDREERVKHKEERESTLAMRKKEFEQKNADYNEIKQKLEAHSSIGQKINEVIRPKISDYQTKRSVVIEQDGKRKFFTGLSAFSAVLVLVATLGVIFSPSLVIYFLVALGVLLLVVSLATTLKYVSNKAQLAKTFDSVKLSAAESNLGGNNIEEILSNIQKFDSEHRLLVTQHDDISLQKQIINNKVNQLRNEDLPTLEKEISRFDRQIEEIIQKSKVTSIDDYTSSLNKKRELEKTVDEQTTKLDLIFETDLEEMEQKIAFWEQEIKKLEGFKDKALSIKYSTEEKGKIEKKLEAVNAELEEITVKLDGFTEDFKEVERRANETLKLEDYIKCETCSELKAVKKVLSDFIDYQENIKADVLAAMEIFDEIQTEDKNKVTTLFGEDSVVSDLFKEITGGFYKSVRLDSEGQKIQVERNDGEFFGAEQLSAGTYDQLYLSIRLSLGQKLLKGEKAFFIMDDPFIKSDKKRLERQMHILSKISQNGWQILYFSAKDEVKDALKDYIENGSVNLLETNAVAK